MKYQHLTTSELEDLRFNYKLEPTYCKIRSELSRICEDSYLLLCPEELWFEAKRLCLILNSSMSVKSSVCEYREDMKALLLNDEKSDNRQQNIIQDTVDIIIRLCWLIYVVMSVTATDEYDRKMHELKPLLGYNGERFIDYVNTEIVPFANSADNYIAEDYYSINSRVEYEKYKKNGDLMLAIPEFEQEMQSRLNKLLSEYKKKPLFREIFDDIISEINSVSFNKEGFTEQNCTHVFEEIECYVSRLKKSTFPEIEMTKIRNDIMTKYRSATGPKTPPNSGVVINTITYDYCIGSIIEKGFIICSFNAIPNKSDSLMESYRDYRTYVESRELFPSYTKGNLWKHIAQIITPTIMPRIEDLELEISQLKEELSKEERLNQDIVIETLRALIDKSSANPDDNKDAAKANLIRALTGYSLSSIGSKLSKLRSGKLKNSDTNKETITELLSVLSIDAEIH